VKNGREIIQMRRALSRRQALILGAGSALSVGLALPSCKLPNNLRMKYGKFGASAVAWSAEVNKDIDPWTKAVRSMYEIGLRRLTLVSFAYVNSDSGVVSLQSGNGLPAGPSHEVLLAAAHEANSLDMEISIRPWVEIDNDSGPGDIWRGDFQINADNDLSNEFCESYRSYVSQMAQLARQVSATRFYIGSEMNGLTNDEAMRDFWLDVISDCRSILHKTDCLLSYAANFDEYETVMFWEDLDEIGIDAYFPLATEKQTRGKGHPVSATLERNCIKMLKRLEQFSKKSKLPLFISEWGVVPFDGTTADPSNELPSIVVDKNEALRAYDAFLKSIEKTGHWLSGTDFWHWSVDPHEDSDYRIMAGSEVGALIQSRVQNMPS
jgi:Glycoside Hydrolase Family 113